ncbi:MAG: hypothetical protein ACO3LE_04010 [Bdellovibrionota bacterium]
MLGDILVWTSFISGLFMTGLIWFVQIVHYPLFALIDESNFKEFHREHAKKTTWVVAAPMMIELVSSGLAIFFSKDRSIHILIMSFSMVFLIFLSTAILQVPLHNRLSAGKNLDLIRKLVLTNWIRTLLWTSKSICLAAALI